MMEEKELEFGVYYEIAWTLGQDAYCEVLTKLTSGRYTVKVYSMESDCLLDVVWLEPWDLLEMIKGKYGEYRVVLAAGRPKHKCNCASRDLLWYGCKCGGI